MMKKAANPVQTLRYLPIALATGLAISLAGPGGLAQANDLPLPQTETPATPLADETPEMAADALAAETDMLAVAAILRLDDQVIASPNFTVEKGKPMRIEVRGPTGYRLNVELPEDERAILEDRFGVDDPAGIVRLLRMVVSLPGEGEGDPETGDAAWTVIASPTIVATIGSESVTFRHDLEPGQVQRLDGMGDAVTIQLEIVVFPV